MDPSLFEGVCQVCHPLLAVTALPIRFGPKGSFLEPYRLAPPMGSSAVAVGCEPIIGKRAMPGGFCGKAISIIEKGGYPHTSFALL